MTSTQELDLHALVVIRAILRTVPDYERRSFNLMTTTLDALLAAAGVVPEYPADTL